SGDVAFMAVLVERDNIGIFGRTNCGKSSLMNLLTQQETSIVDSTAGTTADTKIALQEIHGLGPVKLFDTAGIDEQGPLGDKKRKKVFDALKQCDLVLLIVDPARGVSTDETTIVARARAMDKQLLVVYNLFADEDRSRIAAIEAENALLRFHKKLALAANNADYRQPLLHFILENFEPNRRSAPLLPFLQENEFYVLVIPMDEETPPGRYLRPQAMVEEHITRRWSYPVSFRLDLAKARHDDPAVRETERRRFLSVVEGLGRPPRAIITDSQAMDVMCHWCPAGVMLTTFSIVMIHHGSRGRLSLFVEGLKAVDALKPGDRVLIAEACNHSRIGEDIGTVQIPRYLEKRCPGVVIDHALGREFHETDALSSYKLIVHCGACMIDSQKLLSRIRDIEALGAPVTNYGLLLSHMQGPAVLERVLEPWKLSANFPT
ncbi:MAG: 50S ribosome-binding GTPase, partial [Pirellulales bacterium]|nr:50S ribosome-binding GTPase [Pirellulales bacterium]